MIHGTKKTKKTKSQQQIKADNEMSLKISKNLHEFMELRNLEKKDLLYLTQFTDILMELCSDIPTIYNFRRELVEQQLKAAVDPLAKLKILQDNLKLTTKLLKSDPKSYCIWSFRQWLVSQLYRQSNTNDVILAELELCKLMLMKDEKNFHVWNYRHWLNSLNVDIEVAIGFVHTKIKTNPFNFSPYHFLTKHLPQKYHKLLEAQHNQEIIQFGMEKSVFDSELEMVRTAIFLNPQEEAPWNFYRWLIKLILPCRVIDVAEKEPGKYQLTTSFNTSSLAASVKVNGKHEGFKISSPTEPSNEWLLEIPVSEQKPTIEVSSNFQPKEKYVKTQYGYFFIGTEPQSERVRESLRMVDDQVTFVTEVDESEEGKCRYACLQLLELNRLRLHFGPTRAEWSETCQRSKKILEQLESAAKGQRYIKHQAQVWRELEQGSGPLVRPEERLLLAGLRD